MHLTTGNASKGKGGRAAKPPLWKGFLLPVLFHVILTVSAPVTLNCDMDFPSMHSLSYSSPFSILAWSSHWLPYHNLSRMGIFPPLPSPSFLHGCFLFPKHQMLWTAPFHPSPQGGCAGWRTVPSFGEDLEGREWVGKQPKPSEWGGVHKHREQEELQLWVTKEVEGWQAWGKSVCASEEAVMGSFFP